MRIVFSCLNSYIKNKLVSSNWVWVTIKDGIVVCVCSSEGWECPSGEITFTLTLAMWTAVHGGGIFCLLSISFEVGCFPN